MFKNEGLVFNIGANRKASIGGIDGSQTGMTTVQICYIPYVGVGLFNGKAVANTISWSKCIKLRKDPCYFMEYYTFVL